MMRYQVAGPPLVAVRRKDFWGEAAGSRQIELSMQAEESGVGPDDLA